MLSAALALASISVYGQTERPEPLMGWNELQATAAKNDTVNSALEESGLVIAFYKATITKKGFVKELTMEDEGPLNAGSTEILTRLLKNTTWKPGVEKGKAATQTFYFSFAIERKSKKALEKDSLYRQKVKEFNDLVKQHGDTLEDGSPKNIDSIGNLANPFRQAIQARYPGDDQGFIQHVSNNFSYPSRCLEQSISGSVLLKFRVSPYGLVSHIEIVEMSKGCPEFGEEAVRVLRLSDRWIPAVWENSYIQAYRQLPIALRVN